MQKIIIMEELTQRKARVIETQQYSKLLKETEETEKNAAALVPTILPLSAPVRPFLTVPVGTVIEALMRNCVHVESVTFGDFPLIFVNGASEELNIFLAWYEDCRGLHGGTRERSCGVVQRRRVQTA